jgi:two-component system response regulator DesR
LIRILIWHPSNLVSMALASVLVQEQDFSVVARSGTGHGLFDLVRRERPRVAVIDHAIADTMSVTTMCQRLTSSVPDLRVLVLVDRLATPRVDAELMKLVPQVGLLDTASSPAELVRCVHKLAQGEPVLDVNVAVAALVADRNPLTDREREVLRLAVQGEPVANIAAKLCLSAGTVRNYLARITTKTGARTRIEAIRIAAASGWI